MLIYGENNNNTPLGEVTQYKSAHRRQRSSIRVKALKRATRRKKKRSAVKKLKRVKKTKKRRKGSKKKGLNLKNRNFLKTLGFRLKKR